VQQGRADEPSVNGKRTDNFRSASCVRPAVKRPVLTTTYDSQHRQSAGRVGPGFVWYELIR